VHETEREGNGKRDKTDIYRQTDDRMNSRKKRQRARQTDLHTHTHTDPHTQTERLFDYVLVLIRKWDPKFLPLYISYFLLPKSLNQRDVYYFTRMFHR